jgi:hypothetical protein
VIVSGQATRQAAGAAVHRLIKQAHSVARLLGTRLRESVEAHRRRRVAAHLFTELSRLSDAELKRRGLARDSLYRHVSETGES